MTTFDLPPGLHLQWIAVVYSPTRAGEGSGDTPQEALDNAIEELERKSEDRSRRNEFEKATPRSLLDLIRLAKPQAPINRRA